jgi:hypothetical protein
LELAIVQTTAPTLLVVSTSIHTDGLNRLT